MPALPAQATAPGKLILMGEHAAVYGVPAVVAALGLRTEARVEPVAGRDGLDLQLPDLGVREECSWPEVVGGGNRRRELWRAYRDDPTPLAFSALRAGEESSLVKIAVAETLRALDRDGGRGAPGRLRLTVSSELPIGSGFGSSASVAVAVAAALVVSLTGDPSPDLALVESAARRSEERQHGRPSGVDHTTVMRGGFLYLAPDGAALDVRKLPEPDWFGGSLRIFDTGAPAEGTGEVVAEVRAMKSRSPQAFAESLDRISVAVDAFATALEEREPAWKTILTAVRAAHRGLHRLGVVPKRVSRRIGRIEAAGGAAKISGAGTLSGEGAGSLLVVWPPSAPGAPDEILSGYRPLEACLGSPGLESRLETRGAHVDV